MYRPLEAEGALAYVGASPLMGSFFEAGEPLEVVDLAEGNVNLVFRVRSSRRARSVIVKQALTHARRYPEFKMPLERAHLEHAILTEQARHCPERVPAILLHDAAMFINVLEDLDRHEILRGALLRQATFRDFGAHMGAFLARTLFYTSDLYLGSADKKARVAALTNPVLCKVTEDLVFTQPFRDDPGNDFAPALRGIAETLWRDRDVQIEAARLKLAFVTRAEALIHGDLHTGSIMVHAGDTRVIDPEFGCWGPMSFDIGQVIGNLAMSHVSQAAHAPDATVRTSHRAWLVQTIRTVWHDFAAELERLWRADGNGEFDASTFAGPFLADLLRDSIGMAACEMVRRILGLAHVADFAAIGDPALKAACETRALTVAIDWLHRCRGGLASIDEPVQALIEAGAA
jgi:5-methylthioribose kinase